MKILAFSICMHDSNACLWDGNKFRYMKSERMTGVKHHKCDLRFFEQWAESHNFKPDLIVFTDGIRNGFDMCERDDLFREVKPVSDNSFWKTKTICVDHQYAHILSAWPVVDIENVDCGVCFDGAGDYNRAITIIKNPGNVRSTSFYKSWGDGLSLGRWFQHIGTQLGMKVIHSSDYAGKIMGLQSYGEVNDEYVKSLYPNMKRIISGGKDTHTRIDNLWKQLVPSFENQREHDDFYNVENQNFRDWVASTHKLIEMWIADFFDEHVGKDDTVVYSGGVAQNVLVNDILYSNFKNLIIPPHPYDGGLSLGCMEVGRLLNDLPKIEVSDMTFPYWQDDIEVEIPSEDTINRVAELLSEGKIVGWFQGRGEIGPRALGNRSILMHPGLADGKDIINERVKHREYWRPFAPSLLEEHLSEWFEVETPNKFMLRAVKTKKDKIKQIQSIVHNDDTARIQTVNEDDNPLFYQLIKKFYERTDIPVVLNTSLNDGGLPIFSTRKQCLKFFKEADIDALCMGNTLIEK